MAAVTTTVLGAGRARAARGGRRPTGIRAIQSGSCLQPPYEHLAAAWPGLEGGRSCLRPLTCENSPARRRRLASTTAGRAPRGTAQPSLDSRFRPVQCGRRCSATGVTHLCDQGIPETSVLSARRTVSAVGKHDLVSGGSRRTGPAGGSPSTGRSPGRGHGTRRGRPWPNGTAATRLAVRAGQVASEQQPARLGPEASVLRA